VPGTEVAKNLLDQPRVINHGDNPHRVLANGAAERISVPHAQDEVWPPLGGKFQWRWRRNARAADNEIRR